ncbi:RHS repeat domain-containing protein [Bacteroides congonensis]
MKTTFSRLILAFAFLLAASATSAEETDLKELRYIYENHIETNDASTEYLFHLEFPMVVTVNHAGTLADSTSLCLWKRAEEGTAYALITEAHDYSRAKRTASLWASTDAAGKVRGDTLNLTDAQAFICMSLPAGYYKLTGVRKGEKLHSDCLPELKTNIYAQAASASGSDPIKIPLYRSGVSIWNTAYQGKCTLYYQLSVECEMTIDIEAYETGSNTLILKDAKGMTIAQSVESKIVQQALAPGKYMVSVPVEDGYCKANIRITTTDKAGNTIDNPIPIGKRGISYVRTDITQIADTYGEKEKDIFYSFNLENRSLCRFYVYYSSQPEKSRVSITVLNERKEVIAKAPSRMYSTQIDCDLEPGIYNLVCEGGEGLDGALVVDVDIWPVPKPNPEPEPTPEPDPEPKPEPEIPEQPENYTPSGTRNYIQTIVPTVGSDSVANFSYLSKARHQIRYYDHLGRPVQEIEYKASPVRKDLITYREYDELGRDSRQWLPTERAGNTSGVWMQPEDFISNAGKLYGDNYACNSTVYDGSSLNLIKEEFGPGEEWQTAGHGIKHDYRVNTSDDHCLWLSSGGVRELPRLLQHGTYPAYELKVESAEDEDGHTSYSFTDKQGHLILNRNIADNDTLDTYHVYDDYGNLCFVLPPAATDNLSLLLQTGELPDGEACRIMLDKYAYQYRYDYRNRCVAKKFPGCDWQEMSYDTADRLIFSRDGNQRKRHEWSFQLSDSSERSVLSGIYHGTLNAASYEAFNVYASFKPENASTLYGYVLHYPAEINPDSLEVLKANYYDTYDYKEHLSGFNASLEYVEDENYGKQYADIANLHCKGLITGSMTSTLESGEELYGCYYYDYNRNLIQLRQTTLNGITLVDKSSFNFSGNPTATCEKYGNDITLCKAYTYDHAGRLTCENHVCENDTTAFLYSFDEIGRMKSLTRINGKDSLTTINSYNIRDWLTGIDSPVFKQSLHYTDGAGTPCYNGNVSSMIWQTDTLATRGYKFSYDGLSRLKDANYGEGSSLTDNSNRFDEQVTAYDKMGNILALKRYGQTSASAYGLIDDLSLSYDGNQLQTANDNSLNSVYVNGFEFKDGANEDIEYFYDNNGNLIQDLNKKITDIQYNCLNLPDRIEFGDGNSISYLYDANGTKLRTTHVIDGVTTTTDYCGNAVYENGVFHKLLTEYGYVTLADTAYHYFLQDHQGNNRVVVNQNGTVEEVNYYYPFGGIFASTFSVQPYKYNGKELDRKGGLDWYDYGARMYDAAIGRWHVTDPSAEKFYSLNAYNYCFDNPVKHVDPDGKQGRPVRPPVRRGYRNAGRPNPYAFYPRGMRPQSYTQKTSVSYRGKSPKKMEIMEPPVLLQTVNTPGGNEVQMSNNNEWGMKISGGIDLVNSYKDFKELLISLVSTVRYGENGVVQNSTEIVIDDPQLAMQQLDYEAEARNIEKELGEVDFTGKSMIEIIEMLAERKQVIQDRLGLSPKEIIQTEFYIHPERFQPGVTVRRVLPTIIQH